MYKLIHHYQGDTEEEHDTYIKMFSKCIKVNGLKVNKDICVFSTCKIILSVDKLSHIGILPPDKNKIAAIKDNVAKTIILFQVSSFLVAESCSHQIISNFSSITVPLSKLTKTNQKFI